MKWSVLKKLFSGIIGNSLFFLSLIAITASIPLLKISSVNVSIGLLGALLISTSYILQKISIPSTIDYFDNHMGYYKYLYSLKDKQALSYTHEFAVLEINTNITKLPAFKDKEFRLHPFETIDQYKKVLGDESALYALCILKYSFSDHLSKWTRYYLTASFFVGVTLLYFPPAQRIFEVTARGLDINV